MCLAVYVYMLLAVIWSVLRKGAFTAARALITNSILTATSDTPYVTVLWLFCI